MLRLTGTGAQRAQRKLSKGAKQLTHEVLPSRMAKSTAVPGEPYRRAMNQYAKMASGDETADLNIMTMGR